MVSTVHAAVIAINEAIDKGQAEGTMTALQNQNAMLRNVQVELANDYQDTLSQAKKRKEALASGQVRDMILHGTIDDTHGTNMHVFQGLGYFQ